MPATQDRLLAIRHSFSHVMAEAVLQLFPEAKLAIGPADRGRLLLRFRPAPHRSRTEDLAEIEAQMRAIVAGDHPFVRAVVTREEARKLFKDQPYKLELIDELPEGEEISTYTQDTFTDLCRGPARGQHGRARRPTRSSSPPSPAPTGAATRSNPMLQRIYGTAWESKADLDAHLKRLEEIEKRDHRRLGKELDLFSHPRGGRGRARSTGTPRARASALAIEDFWRSEHLQERLRAPLHAAHRQGVAVGDLRATSASTARTCTRRWRSTRSTTTSSR